MRSKLPWFLFAASLLLNIFFVAGLFYPHFMGHHGGVREWRDPVAAVAEEFSLDDRQVEELEALRDRIHSHRRDHQGDREGFRTMIINALKLPVFDREALAEALEGRRGASSGMIVDMTEDLHGFLAGLSADQKEAFLERAGQRDFLRQLLFPRRSRQD